MGKVIIYYYCKSDWMQRILWMALRIFTRLYLKHLRLVLHLTENSTSRPFFIIKIKLHPRWFNSVECIVVSNLYVDQKNAQTYIIILSHSKSFWPIFLKKLSSYHRDNQRGTSNNLSINLFQLLIWPKRHKGLTPSRIFLALADMLVLRRSGLWRMFSYISAVSRL